MKLFLLENAMLRPKEVCERLGISYATLREYVKRGCFGFHNRLFRLLALMCEFL